MLFLLDRILYIEPRTQIPQTSWDLRCCILGRRGTREERAGRTSVPILYPCTRQELSPRFSAESVNLDAAELHSQRQASTLISHANPCQNEALFAAVDEEVVEVEVTEGIVEHVEEHEVADMADSSRRGRRKRISLT